MSAEGAWIGLDLGTSGLKGVALTAAGAVAARASAGYPTAHPGAGACEQDPGDWLRAVEQVTSQLAAAVPARGGGGVGRAGMTPPRVPAGRRGEPTGPAITWQDSRADARGDELR